MHVSLTPAFVTTIKELILSEAEANGIVDVMAIAEDARVLHIAENIALEDVAERVLRFAETWSLPMVIEAPFAPDQGMTSTCQRRA